MSPDPMDQVWDATPVGMPKLEARNEARTKARAMLVKYLVNDFMQNWYDDGAYGPDVARRGHVGFERRLDVELVQEAVDTGLDERYKDVAEAIAVLEAP